MECLIQKVIEKQSDLWSKQKNLKDQSLHLLIQKVHIQELEQKKEGNGEAIASSMLKMAGLKVPIIAIVIGEGSSGGALALGVGNKVLMLENAIYSILSPEGYASILWKDSSRAKEAAEKMKLTAKDLYDLKVIDKIIKEPLGDKEESFQKVVNDLKKEIKTITKQLQEMGSEEIVEQRYQKFRNMGEYVPLDSKI